MSASSTAPIWSSPSRSTTSTGCSPAKRIEASSTAASAPSTAPAKPPKIAPIGPPRKKPMVPPVVAPTAAPAAASLSLSWARAGTATLSVARATPKARNLRMFVRPSCWEVPSRNRERTRSWEVPGAAGLYGDGREPGRDAGAQRPHGVVDGAADGEGRQRLEFLRARRAQKVDIARELL